MVVRKGEHGALLPFLSFRSPPFFSSPLPFPWLVLVGMEVSLGVWCSQTGRPRPGAFGEFFFFFPFDT